LHRLPGDDLFETYHKLDILAKQKKHLARQRKDSRSVVFDQGGEEEEEGRLSSRVWSKLETKTTILRKSRCYCENMFGFH